MGPTPAFQGTALPEGLSAMLSPHALGQHLSIVLCAVFFCGRPVLLSSLPFG